MGKPRFSNDKGTQIVLSLLKEHGIKRVIASPGTTNIALVASMQIDPWFEMYSAVDERGAAYMACGMAAATGEPVVITCTGATASRNYYPGMTEAYYRKLPVLAITGSHGKEQIGNLAPQVIDRSVVAKDACKMAVYIDKINDEADEKAAILSVNKAILELKHHGGGPVLIDLRVGIPAGFDAESIPSYRKIERFEQEDTLPKLPKVNRIAVFIGCHQPFSKAETEILDNFCKSNNAIVLKDITSNFYGESGVNPQLLYAQHLQTTDFSNIDILIHIGELSGDYYTLRNLKPKEVWRVSKDGELKDYFGKLTKVFEMSETNFFKYYTLKNSPCAESGYLNKIKGVIDNLFDNLPQLPLSNPFVAQVLTEHLTDKNTVIHCARANCARAMNLTNHRDLGIEIRSNVGGFGIDGPISTAIGSALAQPEKKHILLTGDLAFMYDLNALCNHHLPHNLSIILINNGCGTEFRNYDHPGSAWGDDAAPFIAAAGHMGNKSKSLVKNYSESLGWKYIPCISKEDVSKGISELMDKGNDHNIFIEVFTEPALESEAIQKLRTIAQLPSGNVVSKVKNRVKGLFGI